MQNAVGGIDSFYVVVGHKVCTDRGLVPSWTSMSAINGTPAIFLDLECW
jgi:hypothetical protein